ncbi:MAG: hypothetical protein V8Q42_02245 [Anaerovoracaceae bacterium]
MMEALHSAGISNGMITSAAITIILTVIAVVFGPPPSDGAFRIPEFRRMGNRKSL